MSCRIALDNTRPEKVLRLGILASLSLSHSPYLFVSSVSSARLIGWSDVRMRLTRGDSFCLLFYSGFLSNDWTYAMLCIVTEIVF